MDNSILNQLDELSFHSSQDLNILLSALSSDENNIRIHALKTARQFIISSSLNFMPKLEFIIVKIFTLDHLKYAIERELTLKLTRSLIYSNAQFPSSILRVLVAIAEHNDDKLRNVCIETICEIIISHPSIAFECGAIKLLFTLLVEGPKELLDALVWTILHLLDAKDTRKYVRPMVENIASYFTDSYAYKSSDEKPIVCSRLLRNFMKSWSGLIYLATENHQTLRSIIQSLRLPSQGHRNLLLETFLEIIRLTSGTSSAIDFTTYPHLNFVYHFKSMTMIILIEAGLLDALVDICTDPLIHQNLLSIAVEIFKYSKILPIQHSKKIVSLSKLFAASSDFKNFENRYITSTLLQEIELSMRKAERKKYVYNKKIYSEFHTILDKQKEIADDSYLRSLLVESKTLDLNVSEDSWNWDVILFIIENLKKNFRKLDDIIRGTKFFRRLLNFFRPFSHHFTDLKRSKNNPTCVVVLFKMIDTLIESIEGVKQIEESKFFTEIATCLLQITQISSFAPQNSQNYIFSKGNLEKSLASEYFTLLSNVLAFSNGQRIVEDNRILNYLYLIAFTKHRDDICLLFIQKMDLSRIGHGRLILTRLATSGSKNIRKAAINILGKSAREYKKDDIWAFKLLVNLLYDPDYEIATFVVSILENICQQSDKGASVIVKCRPIFVNVEELASPLMTRLLAVPTGFEFLSKLIFIDQELEKWHKMGNLKFVTHIELFIEEMIVSNSFLNQIKSSNHNIPVHFYGELCKTEDGCKLFKKKGYFDLLSRYIQSVFNVDFSCDCAELMNTKAALWAVGYISSSNTGLSFIHNEPTLLRIITELAFKSSCLSIRGTCFYVCGLIGSTENGSYLLNEYGWESSNEAIRFCFPRNLTDLTTLDELTLFYDSLPVDLPKMVSAQYAEILLNIGNLTNHILSNASSKKLSKIRNYHPNAFMEPLLYIQVFSMLQKYHFRLPARRFIQDVLFDNFVLNDDLWSTLGSS